MLIHAEVCDLLNEAPEYRRFASLKTCPPIAISHRHTHNSTQLNSNLTCFGLSCAWTLFLRRCIHNTRLMFLPDSMCRPSFITRAVLLLVSLNCSMCVKILRRDVLRLREVSWFLLTHRQCFTLILLWKCYYSHSLPCVLMGIHGNQTVVSISNC